MKLTKDQIQRIALGAMMLVGVVYAYFDFLLGPLSTSRASAARESAALAPKIDAARAQIAKTTALEAKGPATLGLLKQVSAMIPEGAPIAWVPTKLTELFKRESIEKVSARMISEHPDKEFPGFSKFSWSVEIPSVEVTTLGSALAALENAEPLMEIHVLEIEAGREKVQFQRATFTLHNIVRL